MECFKGPETLLLNGKKLLGENPLCQEYPKITFWKLWFFDEPELNVFHKSIKSNASSLIDIDVNYFSSLNL